MGEIESERWGLEVSFDDLDQCSFTKVFTTKVYRCCAGGSMTRTDSAPCSSPGCVPKEVAMLYFEQNTDTGRCYHVLRQSPAWQRCLRHPVPEPVVPMISEPICGLR